jgi:hypothetical protein
VPKISKFHIYGTHSPLVIKPIEGGTHKVINLWKGVSITKSFGDLDSKLVFSPTCTNY